MVFFSSKEGLNQISWNRIFQCNEPKKRQILSRQREVYINEKKNLTPNLKIYIVLTVSWQVKIT